MHVCSSGRYRAGESLISTGRAESHAHTTAPRNRERLNIRRRATDSSVEGIPGSRGQWLSRIFRVCMGRGRRFELVDAISLGGAFSLCRAEKTRDFRD